MTRRWECRYSSSEMLYLEVTPTDVRRFLDRAEHQAVHTTFESVLAGTLDSEVRKLFGATVIDELKTAVREQMAGTAAPLSKQELRNRRQFQRRGA